MHIDTSFDFRSDTPRGRGKDPDTYSPTLARFHQLLWGKALPDGRFFDLSITDRPPFRLKWHDPVGAWTFTSDAAVPTLRKKAGDLVEAVGEDRVRRVNDIGYTIGGMMIWPSNRIEGKITINGARGLHPRIADRLDLTIECVRRHYSGKAHPLAAVLDRYSRFFDLFGDFASFVDFFLLDDLVAEDTLSVRFMLPFDDFTTPAVPRTASDYRAYLDAAQSFVEARNRRIDGLAH